MGGVLQAQSMGVVCVNDVIKVEKSYAFNISKSLTYDFVLFRINSKYVAYFAAIFVDPVLKHRRRDLSPFAWSSHSGTSMFRDKLTKEAHLWGTTCTSFLRY